MKKRQRTLEKEQKRRAYVAKQRRTLDRVVLLLELTPHERSLLARRVITLPKWPYPKPQLLVDSSARPRPDTPAIQRDIEELLQEIVLNVDQRGELPLNEFFAFFVPVLHAASLLGGSIAQVALDFFNDYFTVAIRAMWRGIDKILVRFSRIDRGLFWVKMSTQSLPGGGKAVQISLRFLPPQTITATLDGVPRVAYRCGAPFPKEGIRWVAWRSSDMGRHDEDREYPVYVQDHVLDKLYERVTIEGPEVRDWMWASLLEPKLFPARRSDEYLVEYRFFSYRLGYLPVRRLADKIVVKTFLFLTMVGTPEQAELYRRWRLGKPEMMHTQLDQLNLFLTTDVQNDPVLRAILSECGCGHLLDMAKPELRTKMIRGHANDLRKFLGIDDQLAHALLARGPTNKTADLPS